MRASLFILFVALLAIESFSCNENRTQEVVIREWGAENGFAGINSIKCIYGGESPNKCSANAVNTASNKHVVLCFSCNPGSFSGAECVPVGTIDISPSSEAVK